MPDEQLLRVEMDRGNEPVLANRGSFRNLAELKQTFKSVEYVSAGEKGFYMFNIGGNFQRLASAPLPALDARAAIISAIFDSSHGYLSALLATARYTKLVE